MTRTTNARVAGFTFLFYIATGVASMVLMSRASSGEGVAAKLASLAQHAAAVRSSFLLALLGSFSALVLAVTLHALTRGEDPDLALLGLACRVGEGLVGLFPSRSLALLWLATATGAQAPDAAGAQSLGAFLLHMGAWNPGALLFALGSTIFSWLFLRGRLIPEALAWLGLVASVLLLAVLPLQLVGLLAGLIPQLVWLPMLVFEVGLAVWLIVKGVRAPEGSDR